MRVYNEDFSSTTYVAGVLTCQSWREHDIFAVILIIPLLLIRMWRLSRPHPYSLYLQDKNSTLKSMISRVNTIVVMTSSRPQWKPNLLTEVKCKACKGLQQKHSKCQSASSSLVSQRFLIYLGPVYLV